MAFIAHLLDLFPPQPPAKHEGFSLPPSLECTKSVENKQNGNKDVEETPMEDSYFLLDFEGDREEKGKHGRQPALVVVLTPLKLSACG